MFQKNSKSRIILNGHLSSPFQLHRGCRQGDPISPYIFILCSEFLALALNNEEDFKGLTLVNKEHKLSQYADDTSIFMEASDKNLDMSLKILTWFYEQSGLKINFSKTKVIRLGNIRETDRRFGRENNLDWVYEFTALCIEYNVLRMEDITNININNKLESMKKTINAWSCRNFTPVGRITIFKSLIISKIVHIIQSLPTMSQQSFKILDEMAYTFIWNKKRHEVNKKNLCKNLQDGGLKMLNLKEFDKSLKITWIRKLLNTSPEWEEFATIYKIERLISTDTNYHNYIIQTTCNPFWKSVAESYKDWYAIFKEVTEPNAYFIPIWGNNKMNIPFNPIWYRKGLRYVSEMYDENGTPLTQELLGNQLGIRIQFTHFYAFWSRIPGEYSTILTGKQKSFNLQKPPNIEWITKDKKGGVNIRKIWEISNTEYIPIGRQRWDEQLDNPEDIIWEYSYMLTHKCRMNPRIRYFQYQILNRSLITNKKLRQFNLLDHDTCDECGTLETICHMLYECRQIRNLWTILERWLSQTTGERLTLDLNTILLGNKDYNYIVNYVIIVTKHEIYRYKWNHRVPNLADLKRKLKSYLTIEMYIGTISNTVEKTIGKWSPIYNVIRNI